MQLDEILALAIKKGASDIHLKAGIVPVIRRYGKLRPLHKDMEKLSGEQIERMVLDILDDRQKQEFMDNQQIDLGHGVTGLGRFRINAFYQRGTIRMVIRNIPHDVPTLEQLQLPEVLKKVASTERGLVLVTGVTGSGKSSTLAAMVNHINHTKNKHILTLEDPIEFLIRDRKSIITQREIGVDTRDYNKAFRAALRQDPDVILIGEMRDRETIETALLAAETGHLVLSTLHTIDAPETINRVVAAFEPHQQQQIRHQLASVLTAVVSQRLARSKDKKSYVPAVEILVNNSRVRDMIEDPERTREIINAIEEGHVSFGMQSFDQSLMDLLKRDAIDYDTALQLSTRPEDFAIRYSGISDGNDQEIWKSSSSSSKRERDEWDSISLIEIDLPPTGSDED